MQLSERHQHRDDRVPGIFTPGDDAVGAPTVGARAPGRMEIPVWQRQRRARGARSRAINCSIGKSPRQLFSAATSAPASTSTSIHRPKRPASNCSSSPAPRGGCHRSRSKTCDSCCGVTSATRSTQSSSPYTVMTRCSSSGWSRGASVSEPLNQLMWQAATVPHRRASFRVCFFVDGRRTHRSGYEERSNLPPRRNPILMNTSPRRISAPDAAGLVKSGDWVEYGTTLCQPDVFDQALAERKAELRDVKIRGCLSMRPRAVLEADPAARALPLVQLAPQRL